MLLRLLVPLVLGLALTGCHGSQPTVPLSGARAIAFEERCAAPSECLARIARAIGTADVGAGVVGPPDGPHQMLTLLTSNQDARGRATVYYELDTASATMRVSGVGPTTALYDENSLEGGTPVRVAGKPGTWDAQQQLLTWQVGAWIWSVRFGSGPMTSAGAIRAVDSWHAYWLPPRPSSPLPRLSSSQRGKRLRRDR